MIIAILGPTAVGKTALSIALAKKYKADIINFDSMQVYVKLDIGTAKVTSNEMEGIPHHLLSNVSLDKNYSVYDYQKDARSLIDKLQKENKNIILVGGTGLYLKATLFDYNFTEGTTNNLYNDLTNEEILAKIKSYNIGELPHLNNRKRLVRLLNKLENNESITNNGNNLLYKDTIFIGLTTDRNVLYDKINKRVDIMFDNGLIEEVESLKSYFKNSKALNTGIGYKEFIPYFNKEKTLEEVKNDIKKNSRHYAKRQYTFFNHQFNLTWFNTNYDNFDKTINEVINYIETSVK